MTTTSWIIGLAVLAQGPKPADAAADSVTFRDGKVALGQVVESDRRGPLLMLVRRDWARANLADRAEIWRKAEDPLIRQAETKKRDRLTAWRRARPAQAPTNDRITPWIDRELTRPAEPLGSYLMTVRLSRTDVKAIIRKPPATTRMLRLGWTLGLDNVETMPLADLEQTLEGRGYAPGMTTPVKIEGLLPPQPMTDTVWLARRAATEVANDPGGRFLRYNGALLPEPPPGEAPPAGASLEAATSALKGLLGEPVSDPLPGRLRELTSQGRVGAVVTNLVMAPDFSTTTVQMVLWVRDSERGWRPALEAAATARPDNVAAGAGAPLADDPQVKAAFGVIESLGLGAIPPELKQRSLAMGAATRQALGAARTRFERDLEDLVFTLESPRDPAPKAP